MKRKLCFWIFFLLLTFFSGCRVRLLTDAAQADLVMQTEALPTQPTTEAPTAAPQTTEPLPPTTAETEAPVTTTAPPETAEQTEPTETKPPEPRPSETKAPDPSPSETKAPETTPTETEAPQEPVQATAEASPEAEPNPAPGAGSGQTGPGPAGPAPRPETEPRESTETEPPETSEHSVTLTLLDNGGDTGTMTVVVYPGECYGNLPQASRRGWSFDGWWTEAEEGVRITSDTLVETTEDHFLYAHWLEQDALTLRFDGNGGRVRPYDQEARIRYGECYGTLPTPLREGYDFSGWWTEAQGGEQIDADSVFLQETDQTLYAHWSYNAFAYWSFLLQNGNQRRYLCQTLSLYVELEEPGHTMLYCDLIADTESYNIAENRSDPYVTDDWVLAKNPDAVLKLVPSLSAAASVRNAVSLRFPGKAVYLMTEAALGEGAAGLYARMALCKALYPTWYTEIDLAKAAAELGLTEIPFQ